MIGLGLGLGLGLGSGLRVRVENGVRGAVRARAAVWVRARAR